MVYNFDFDIAALCLNVLLLSLTLFRRSYPGAKKFFYILMLLCNFFAIIFDIISVYTISFPENYTIEMNYFVNIMYYLFHNLTSFMFVMYGLITENWKPEDKKIKIFWALGLITVVGLVISTPWTGFAFTFDENGVYQQGKLLYLFYVIGVGSVVYNLSIKVRSKHNITGFKVFSHFIYAFLLLGSFLVHIFFNKILIELFAINVGFVLLYTAQDNPDAYLYKGLAAFNRKGFEENLRTKISRNENFSILFLVPNNLYFQLHTNSDNLIFAKEKQIIRILRNDINIGAKNLYVLDDLCFAVFVKKGDENNMIHYIQNAFKNAIEINDIGYNLYMRFGEFKYPGIAKKYSQAGQVVDNIIEKLKESESDKVVEPDINCLVKDRAIEITKIVKEIIQTKFMQIQYEPICSTKLNSCLNAEAKMVVLDEKGSRINMSEFLPVIMGNGLVVDIDLIKIEKIGEFLRRSDVLELGIKTIGINLSSTTLVEIGFLTKLSDVIKKNNIPTNKINIEYIDMGGNVNNNIIFSSLLKLKEMGFNLTLDGYGEGFSDTAYLVDSPFDTIKISPKIVELINKGESGKELLKGIIKTIKNVGKVSICEGVNDIESSDFLKSCGCDYLQGKFIGSGYTGEGYIDFVKDQFSEILTDINNR